MRGLLAAAGLVMALALGGCAFFADPPPGPVATDAGGDAVDGASAGDSKGDDGAGALDDGSDGRVGGAGDGSSSDVPVDIADAVASDSGQGDAAVGPGDALTPVDGAGGG